MPVRSVQFGPRVTIGGGHPLVLIAGPCVIESAQHCREMATALCQLTADLGIPFVFKSSYDKANRSSVSNFRGPGVKEGMEILAGIRQDFGCPVLTDVHTVEEMVVAEETIDVIQIPAFLCRQTDLLVAAGLTGRAVNVKKGQFAAPDDMANAVEKVASTGNRNVTLTERGASFGYHNLVVDMRSLPIMRATGTPVIFDATHSVQLPGAKGGSSGGEGKWAPILARAAVGAGIDGLFVEVHEKPECARCDGPNMIPLRELRGVLEAIMAIDRVVRPLL